MSKATDPKERAALIARGLVYQRAWQLLEQKTYGNLVLDREQRALVVAELKAHSVRALAAAGLPVAAIVDNQERILMGETESRKTSSEVYPQPKLPKTTD